MVPFKRVRIIGVGGDEQKVRVHKLPKRLQGAVTTAAARIAVSDSPATRAWLQTAQAVVNDDRPARAVLQEMLNRRTRSARTRSCARTSPR